MAKSSLAPSRMELAVAREARKETSAVPKPGYLGRAIDAAIRDVAPGWARKRQQSRNYLALGDGYDITKPSNKRRGRNYTGGTADKHLDATTLFKLREICYDFYRNSPLMHGIIERWADNVVGPTFNFYPATSDSKWNEAAHDYIDRRMGKACDIRRRMSFRRLVRAWLISVANAGDVLPVFTPDGIQTYEADQLVSPYNGAASVEFNGRSILNGVHVDKRTGRDLGYYVAPRSYEGWMLASDYASKAKYIPASEAIFPANLHRTSQTRGVPIVAASLGVFDHLDGYLENEQIAAEVSAALVYTITRTDPSFFLNEDDELPEWIRNETSLDGTAQQLLKAEPGQIINGAAGDKVDMLNPNRPGNTFEPYVVTALRMIGAGIGMPLELVLLDFSRTNYSSARAALLQAYRTFRTWQEFVKEEMLQPVYERWIGQGIVEGELTLRADAFRVSWMMPQWAWIDPWREVQAAEKAIQMGSDTLTDTIMREGRTLADYVRIRDTELQAFRTAGIPTTTAPGNLLNGEPSGQTAAPTEALKEETGKPLETGLDGEDEK